MDWGEYARVVRPYFEGEQTAMRDLLRDIQAQHAAVPAEEWQAQRERYSRIGGAAFEAGEREMQVMSNEAYGRDFTHNQELTEDTARTVGKIEAYTFPRHVEDEQR